MKFRLTLQITVALAVGGACLPVASFAQDSPPQGFLGTGWLTTIPEDYPNPVKDWLNAPSLAPWDIEFQNSLHWETYRINKNPSLSPYQYRGHEPYDDMNLFMTRRYSENKIMRVQADGVYSQSRYRSSKKGLTPERLNFQYENGEGDIPYRYELGDFYASFSPRTLQTSLKGGVLEFQPTAEKGPFKFYSVQMLAGISETNWLEAEPNENSYLGLSVLGEESPLGTWIFNFVNNQFERDVAAGTPRQSQYVASIAGEKNIKIGTEALTFETEMAAFNGDHYANALDINDVDMNVKGSSFFYQISGRSDYAPMGYRLKYEFNDEDFRPRTSTVTADRRAYEQYLTWNFENQIQIVGRGLQYTDDYSLTDHLQTNTAGFKVVGPLGKLFQNNTITGTLDIYRQWSHSTSRGVNSRLTSYSTNLSAPLPQGWLGHLDLLSQHSENHVSTVLNSVTRQASFSADKAVKIGGWQGSITPGLTARTVKSQLSATEDFHPTFSVNLDNGPHAFDATFGVSVTNSIIADGVNNSQKSLAFNYAYTVADHSLRLEGDHNTQDLDPGDSGEGSRIAFVWTYNLNKPARDVEKDEDVERLKTVARLQAISPDGVGLLEAIPPGATVAAAEQVLLQQRLFNPAVVDGLLIYENRRMDDVLQRQRIALSMSANKINESTLIVDFSDTGDLGTTQQLYNKVRDIMIARYGSPVTHIEKGDFSGNIEAKIKAQTLIRALEWRTDAGILRFGIPRRLDGIVRMELRHAAALPNIRSGLWGLERVR